MSVYNELRLEEKLCDGVIRVDKAEFPVHKIILCNCSSYFRNLFTHWSTPDSRVFDIPNVSSDMMKLIIEFAYTDFVPVTEENIEELFIAADQFDVKGIIQACCQVLEENLAPQNCISIWVFTDIYYTPELNHKAFLFTLNHFEEAADSSEFLQLSAEKLVKIIESDRLNVKQEKTVFAAILRWITYATEERREYIPLLLSNVRLALTSAEYITDIVSNNELVTASQECQPILLRSLEAMYDRQAKLLFSCTSHNPLARPRLPPAILLAVGGWSGNNPTNGIEAYDVRADCWVNITNNGWVPRAYHGVVFLDGSVYCIGGFDGVAQSNSVFRFDPGLYTWQEVTQMQCNRCYVSVTEMDGCIYALGGYDGHDRLRTVECYKPRTNQWTLIAPMHEKRSDASCTTLRGKVYICGGFDGNECLSSAECYNPETSQWTLIASMASRRSGIGVITYANSIFAVGGFNGTSRLRSAEAYNPDTNSWHAMPSMRVSRSNYGIAVIDDHLFVVGGFNGYGTCTDVEFYDVKAGVWYYACDMKISRSALRCCVMYGLPNLDVYAAPHHSLTLSDVEVDEVE